MSVVLVIGAAGKTGRAVTTALVARGATVRAGVRPGSRSQPVDHPSVGRVLLDLETGEGIAEAAGGCDAVHHLAPNVHPDEIGMATRVVRAAAAAGVPHVVFHSVLHPRDVSMPHHLRKGQAEDVVRAVYADADIVRPSAYLQNLLGPALAGRLSVPYSLETPFDLVDLDDVAEVTARLLVGGGPARRTVDLVGPERRSIRELAGEATQVLARPVIAEEITLEAWVRGPGAGLDAARRAALMAMFRAYDAEGLTDDSTDLERWLGRPGRTWRELLGSVPALR